MGALLVLSPSSAGAQGRVDLSFLTTRAEASAYRETTRYAEVKAFLDVLTRSSERIRQTTFGYSVKGRPLPLAIFGTAEEATPQAVLRTGKPRVFVQANIHAGEVAGKEAALMLLRKLAAGKHTRWADSLVVLVAPIYNADGNEDISLYHRPLQLGPVGGMGRRTNAQGLDLNRDHMKLDSPETRSLVRLFRQYDPHVVIDLHTTNGTHHGYHLTYAPPLHPGTPDTLVQRLRGEWLPTVRNVMRQEHGYETYYFGHAGKGYYGRTFGPGEPERGWYTFSHRPRFNNNYVGLRGRFALLSEAYAYAPFEERILASLYFTEAAIDYAARHAGALRGITEAVDRRSVVGDTMALRAAYQRSDPSATILMGEVERLRHPYTGEPMLRRRNVQQPEQMPVFGTFKAAATTRVPEAYYVPDSLREVIGRLKAHGIQYAPLDSARTARLQRFRIDSVAVADEPYQGRRAHTLYGTYEEADVAIPAGTIVVPADQPLGRLVVLLLEPRSDDGLAHWGFFEELGSSATSSFYPILRRPAVQNPQDENP